MIAVLVEAFFHRQCAALAVLLGQPRRAAEHWSAVCRLQPQAALPRLVLARLHADAQRIDEALALLHEAAELAPQDAAPWFNIGFLQQQRSEHVAALESFDRALALDERLDRAWYGKALSLLKLQRVDEAIVALRRNTALQPFGPYGWYQLAHAYRRIGAHEQAARIAERLMRFEPGVARQLARELAAPGAGLAE